MKFGLPTSRILAFISLALWMASLGFTGFSIEAESKRYVGVEILAFGWLALLTLNLAWLANPILIWSFFAVQSGKRAVLPALLGVLCALDTLRFSSLLLNAAGHTSAVYGYGWGCVLWFSAMVLMTSAAGSAEKDGRASSADETYGWLLPLGMVAFFVVWGTAAYLAVTDRIDANQAEKARLSDLAFKRWEVCKDETQLKAPAISELSGPLEVVFNSKTLTSIPYPFENPATLLDWGVPEVRYSGRDYSYRQIGSERVLISVSATKAVGATLFVESLAESSRGMHIRLDSLNRQPAIIDQIWRPERYGYRYCPDFSPFPKDTDDPRRLLSQALGLTVAAKPAPTNSNQNFSAPVNMIILTEIDALLSIESIKTSSKSQRAIDDRDTSLARNAYCPEGVMWGTGYFLDGNNTQGARGAGNSLLLSREQQTTLSATGYPFIINGVAYYLGRRTGLNLVCSESSIYLYSGSMTDSTYSLIVEKRKVSDFRLEWREVFRIPGVPETTQNDRLKVNVLVEEGRDISFVLTNEQTGFRTAAKASLPGNR